MGIEDQKNSSEAEPSTSNKSTVLGMIDGLIEGCRESGNTEDVEYLTAQREEVEKIDESEVMKKWGEIWARGSQKKK